MGGENVGGGVGGSPVSSGSWSGQFFGDNCGRDVALSPHQSPVSLKPILPMGT